MNTHRLCSLHNVHSKKAFCRPYLRFSVQHCHAPVGCGDGLSYPREDCRCLDYASMIFLYFINFIGFVGAQWVIFFGTVSVESMYCVLICRCPQMRLMCPVQWPTSVGLEWLSRTVLLQPVFPMLTWFCHCIAVPVHSSPSAWRTVIWVIRS